MAGSSTEMAWIEDIVDKIGRDVDEFIEAGALPIHNHIFCVYSPIVVGSTADCEGVNTTRVG